MTTNPKQPSPKAPKRHFAWMPYDKGTGMFLLPAGYKSKAKCLVVTNRYGSLIVPVRVEIVPVVREKKAEKPAKSIFPLQVGKTYETRDGATKVKITKYTADEIDYKFAGSVLTNGSSLGRVDVWTVGGCFWDHEKENKWDLVREVAP